MLCSSCSIEYVNPGYDLCENCIRILREWTRENDEDPNFWELVEMDINWKQLDKIKKDFPDFLPNYISAVKKSNKDKSKGAPTWTRSSGEVIKIKDMNNFHLRGAMGKVHKFTKMISEQEGVPYLEAVPPVYWSLRSEMTSRGMSIPNPN